MADTTTQLKVLDQQGLEHLWSKISMQDYPNNATLIAVIDAIDKTKADKTELPDEPLKGSTDDITPNEALLAIATGRPVSITYTDDVIGSATFNYFAYNTTLDTLYASLNFTIDDTIMCVQLAGSLSTNQWTFLTDSTIRTAAIDTTLTQSQRPADAKTVGDLLNAASGVLALKNETLFVTLSFTMVNNEKVYSMDKTFEEINTHYNKGYPVIVILNDEICYLVSEWFNMMYTFQGYHSKVSILQDESSLTIQVTDITPDTTLSQSGRAADANSVGLRLAERVKTSDLPTVIEDALTQAKESGEFDGADGYTPERGIDYWTEDDVNEIKAYVDEAILGGAW